MSYITKKERAQLELDAARYRAIRNIAVRFHSLEASVAFGRLDFVKGNHEFDTAVDEVICDMHNDYDALA